MNKNLLQGVGLGLMAGAVAAVLVVNNAGTPVAESKQDAAQQESSPDGSVQALVEASSVPEALQAAGVEPDHIEARFDAGGGLAGFIVHDEQRHKMPVLVYATADGSRLLNGTLFDREGNQLSRTHLTEQGGYSATELQRMARAATQDKSEASDQEEGPDGASVRDALSQAELVTQGSGEAELYALMDTNCPYCSRLYETVQSMRDEVTVHWVLVGYQGEGSRRDAATILAHDDPADALERVMGGESASSLDVETPDREGVDANTELAQGAGLRGTPQGAAVTPEGEAEYIRGALPEPRLREALGL